MSLDLYINRKSDGLELFSKNITHNLNIMAMEAEVYHVLWRPEETNSKYAKDILDVLEKGLKRLKENPKKYKKLNPINGWGTYEYLIEFVEEVIKACKKYPNGILNAHI